MMKQAGTFNAQVFLETLCNAVFALLLLYLVRSGNYLNYVTPRLAPYLYFTAAVTLIWCVGGISRLRLLRRRARSAHCFVLAAPILLLLLPHTPLSSADLSWSYTGGGPAAPVAYAAQTAATDLTLDTVAGYVPEADSPARPSGADEADKSIIIDNDNFYAWLNELYANTDKYEGWQIYFTGFVFKDPEVFLETEFMASRLGMTCCAADLVPYGLICRYAGTPGLAPGSWITVEGIVHAGEYDGWPEPQITVTGLTAAEEVPGYIYPFG